jgi:hypothetical protein
LVPALHGEGVEEFALVLEVVIGGGWTDAGFPGDRPQGDVGAVLSLQKASPGLNKCPAQVTVMVGARLGKAGGFHEISVMGIKRWGKPILTTIR